MQMYRLESHLLSTIKHENVLNGRASGVFEQSIGYSPNTVKGPFQVTKTRNIPYIVSDLGQEFNLGDFLANTGCFTELHSLIIFL